MKSLLRIGLAAVAISCSTSALAGYVVVRASGPSANLYPVGRQLSDNSRVELRDGDSLLLLGPSSARQLRGPGSFTIAAQQLAMSSRGRFGAQRALFLKPSPWDLDVAKGGAFCVAEGKPFSMWRLDAAETVELQIHGSGHQHASVEWPAKQAKFDWPAQLPVSDGAKFELSRGEGTDPVVVEIRTLDAAPDDQLSMAQALIERGCNAQLEVLVRSSPLED